MEADDKVELDKRMIMFEKELRKQFNATYGKRKSLYLFFIWNLGFIWLLELGTWIFTQQ